MSGKSTKRLSAQETLAYLQNIVDWESGSDSNSSQNDESDEDCVRLAETSDSSDDSDYVYQINESDDNNNSIADIGLPDATRTSHSSRGRSRGRGRGRGIRVINTDQVSTSINSSDIAKDGTVWNIMQPNVNMAGRFGEHNVLKEKPGPSPYAERNIGENLVSAFKLIIDGEMLNNIRNATVAEARTKLGVEWNMTLEELEAYIGILYARGAYGAAGLDRRDLWCNKWGPSFFRNSMARNRFLEISKYLRFDMKSTRAERLASDKFACVSEVWNKFIENSQMCYTPGENICIDEQLFPSKARCKWTQYIATKPDKFGIKFWLATDVESKYLVNGFPYLGKDDLRPDGVRLGDYVVTRLMDPFTKKGRNVTTDNFFTSMKLAKDLRLLKTSIVGTVNRVRRELPACVADTKSPRYTTKLLVHDGITLTIYRCKPTKNVVLMSTLHPSITIGDDGKKKPETVQFYNNTKYGVDVLDQMAREYTVKAASRRWPVHVFYNVLDLAAINAWILYKEATLTKISRRAFLLQLAEELVIGYTSTRKTTESNVSLELRSTAAGESMSRKRRHCQLRKDCQGLKTNQECTRCKKPVCSKCIGNIEKLLFCIDCAN